MELLNKIERKILRANIFFKTAAVLILFLISTGYAKAQNTTSTCSGVSFSYNNEPGYVAGETYSWTIASFAASISGQTIGLGGASAITQTLTNSSNTPATIVYNVITSQLSTFTLTVTVNPTASLTNAASFVSPICSGVAQSYSATSNIVGTSITWTRAVKPGINNLAGTGTNTVTESLNNTTNAPITVPYLFTLNTSGPGCVSSQTINAVINPIPVLTSTLTPPAICSNTNFSYNPTANTASPTFSWTRAIQPNINNPSASGPGNPNELLQSNSTSQVPVAYVYTTTSNGCSYTQTVTVPVNPTPVVSTTQPASACNNSSFTINPSSVVPAGTLYSWPAPIISPTAGAITGGGPGTLQNMVNQTLTNTTTGLAQATYTITPTTAGCTGPTFQGVVTVNNVGTGMVLPNINNYPACNNAVFNVVNPAAPPGTSYVWTAPTYSPAGSLSGGTAQGSAQNSISGTLVNNTIAPGTATYNVTPVSGACFGTVFTVSVTVNNPAVLSSSLTPPDICSNSLFSYTPTSVTATTSFTWSRVVVAGISNTAATGTGNPNEVLINITSAPVKVIYLYTLTTGSCVNQQSVAVFVNPSPTLSSGTPNPVCSGSTLNYNPLSLTAGTSFAWARPVVPSISNPSATGTGDPNEVLINTGITPVLVPYNYTLTANGCTNTQTINVLVNPMPVVTNQITTACNNSAFVVTPTTVPAGTQYTWIAPVYNPVLSLSGGSAQGTLQNNISQTLINSTLNNATAKYTVTPIANGCTGATFTVTVTVYAPLNLSSTLNPPAICNNTVFSYTPTSNTAGTSFGWTRAAVAGINNPGASGTNNPNETLINITSNPIAVTYLYTLTSPNGCIVTQTVNAIVNPSYTLSNPTPAAICSSTAFNFGPTSSTAGAAFTWTRAAVPFISNVAASGSGNINETLINTSNTIVAVNYIYTISTAGCSSTQTIGVNVKPVPQIANQTAIACNNTSFIVNPTGAPLGTVYSWGFPTYSPAGSITGATIGNSQTNFTQTLTNSNALNATATYTLTPVTSGCIGSDFNLAVTVNNSPVLSSSLTPAAICSNTVFNYSPSSITTGTTFGWTRSAVAGISNATASGVGNPAETLINTTAFIVAVPYLYTLTTPTGCVNTQTVTVNVDPAPVLNSGLVAASICTGTLFSYTPTSASPGATFSWSRPAVPAISNAPATGSGLVNPSEILVNTSSLPVSVPYNYTIVANGCSNNQTVTVVVNPKPVVPNQSTTICGNTAFSVIPTGVIAGTQYTWTIPTATPIGSISGGSAQSVLQDSISQILGNTTINLARATYTVTPTANGCSGSSFTVDVFVKPTPGISNQIISSVCSGVAFNYAATAVPAGTTYTWSNPIISPASSLTGGSAQAINQTSVSQTLSSVNNLTDTATYVVTPTSGGCLGANFNLVVPVKPVPFINNIFDTVCSGAGFTVIPKPVPANTTYTWTLPTSIPFGRVIGGSANAVPVNVISQVPVNTGATPAQLLYTITPNSNGCTGSTFTLLETVGVPLLPIPNAAATICSGTSFDVTPTSTPPNTTYTWSIPSATPVGMVSGLSPQATAQTRVTGTLTNLSAVTATAIYTITPFNTGCTGSAFTATITIRAVPKATITGNATICAYVNDTLTVSFAGTAPWSFNYLDNGVPKTQVGITTNPFTWIVPTPLLASTKTLAITYVKDMACIDSVDTSYFVQKVNPLPIGHVVSMHGQYICNNIPDTLFVGYTMDTLSFQWTRNGVQLPGLNSDSIATLIPGRYNAYFTNKYGCTDTSAIPATLTYIAQPVIKFNYDSYCINNLINFRNLTDTTFTGPTSWLWNMGDSTTRNSFHATDTYFTAGKRSIKITASQLYCPAYTTVLDSVINIEFPIAGIRMPSVSAYLGQFTPIAARSIPTYKYLWTPTRGIDHPDSASINFNYQQTQEYLINLIAASGCISYDTVLVRVFNDKLVDIFVPKSFTPNGDGINDVLYPYLTGIKTFKYFKVYNRFGKLMFETTNPDAGWNGMVGGTQQPMAIYIWVSSGIALDGTTVEKRGETLLLR
ncbi:MAG: gliding motility-associated C-terminal domain-containing protein [Chitinophagaceae bacterium]|nr:gliding motility-associated C-terminal domain-containing protein [Chitinophagaceae bacterium]